MSRIETLYVVNHSHTDIGFTDHQDVCFRQHCEFIEQALDLCEVTADYPEEARYRWVCEVTATTERYLRNASTAQRERFLTWHRRGSIDVAGMQYNLTPMLDVEQIHRSLYPVRRLREEFGVDARVAMQCDVNGVSWLYADLLPAIGIDFLTMAVNPIRGGAPKPRPSAFWWEGPAGGRVLAWNGYHYLFGRSIAKLGDWRFVERFLPPIIDKLEADPDYPFDFLYCQSTHPVRVDNGPPDARMPDFVREWNASGRTPRIAFTTPSEFGRLLRERHGSALICRRGDWTDWWADGVASSAFETGLSRRTHELLGAAESIGAWLHARGGVVGWDSHRLADVYEQATLYDEHTWGAFASIAAPADPWTRSQWNRKAGFGYSAWAEAQDVLSRAAHKLARSVATPGPEGFFNLGDLTPEEAYPASSAAEVLVINTLPWQRAVAVEEPESRGQAAPAGMLDMFMARDIPWGGLRPPTPLRRLTGLVPALGHAFLSLDQSPVGDDLRVGPNLIENKHYRVRVDPVSGGIDEWLDKELGYDFAGSYRGWRPAQYVYERVDSVEDRDALFSADFSHEDFGVGRTDTPFRYAVGTAVKVSEPLIEQGQASIVVDIRGDGIRSGRCVFSLESGRRELAIDWLLDKQHVTEPEAVFIGFPFNLGSPLFLVDLNGVACRPNADQLAGTVRDWYPVQRWVDVSDDLRGVTLAPLDSPLVQLGGITTGRWASTLDPESATLMSWVLHNHWMVNFKASQGGQIPLRYRLTTHRGRCDAGAAARFGAEQSTPPIVLRDYCREGAARSGSFADVGDDGVLVTTKPAEDGDGVVLRVRNVHSAGRDVAIAFRDVVPTSVHVTSPVEVDGDELPLDGSTVHIPMDGVAVRSLRARF